MSIPPSAPTARPRWEILLSHHPPDRFGRTLGVSVRGRTVHLCARCTGQVVGLSTFLVGVALLVLVTAAMPPLFWTLQPFVALAPLPAAVDWLTQSLGRRESGNRLRLLSGALRGVAFADAAVLLWTREWFLFAGAVVIFVGYVSAIALVLKVTGGWRRVLQEHFPGVAIDNPT